MSLSPFRSPSWLPNRWLRRSGDRARDQLNWPEACRCYERYLLAAADDGAIWVQLGHARKESGDPSGAGLAYRRALTLDPKSTDALEGLNAIMSRRRSDPSDGHAARAARDWPRAARAYKAYLRDAPNDGEIWIQYGHALKESEDAPGAILAYRQASGLRASQSDGLFHLGCAMRSQGLDEAAEPHLRQAFRLDRRFETFKAAGGGLDIQPDERVAASGRALVLEITDLFSFLSVHGFIGGAQRVQLALLAEMLEADHCAGSAFERVDFAFSEFYRPWTLRAEDLRPIVAYAAHDPIDVGAARRLIDQAKNGATLCAPARGSAFLALGSIGGGLEARAQRASLRGSGVAVGALIHDISPIASPELHEAGAAKRFEADLREGLAHWDFLIASSAATAHATRNYISRAGARRVPVVAVPLAHGRVAHCDPGKDAAWPPSLEDLKTQPFALCVGAIEPWMNHSAIIEAWTSLVAADPDTLCLVLVGRRGWGSDAVIAGFKRSGLLRRQIRWMERVSDRELANLYEACAFTVFPAFAGAWGLPIGESLAHGKVCVASNSPSMPRAWGAGAIYVDPHDIAALTATLARLLGDRAELRRRECEIKSSFHARTWSEVADDLVRVSGEGL